MLLLLQSQPRTTLLFSFCGMKIGRSSLRGTSEVWMKAEGPCWLLLPGSVATPPTVAATNSSPVLSARYVSHHKGWQGRLVYMAPAFPKVTVQLAEEVKRLNWTQQELQSCIAPEGPGFLWHISLRDQSSWLLIPFAFAIHQCSFRVFPDCVTPPNENKDGNQKLLRSQAVKEKGEEQVRRKEVVGRGQSQGWILRSHSTNGSTSPWHAGTFP